MNEGVIVPELFPNEAQRAWKRWKPKEITHSGTVVLRGAVKACRSGVRRSHLISYQEDGALLQGAVLPRRYRVMQIVNGSAEQIRRATINDYRRYSGG